MPHEHKGDRHAYVLQEHVLDVYGAAARGGPHRRSQLHRAGQVQTAATTETPCRRRHRHGRTPLKVRQQLACKGKNLCRPQTLQPRLASPVPPRHTRTHISTHTHTQ
jgi:hypothetical protein